MIPNLWQKTKICL